ncbi:uncharacterized protein ACR2FA_010272 [Aphomia sociella]
MAVKYFVHAGGRWREVRLDGRVSGWAGRARFMCVKRGRLCTVSNSAVLRGLRSLAANRPTTVKDGLPLSQLRCDPKKKEQHIQEERCCWDVSHRHRCSGVQVSETPAKADAAVQASEPLPLTFIHPEGNENVTALHATEKSKKTETTENAKNNKTDKCVAVKSQPDANAITTKSPRALRAAKSHKRKRSTSSDSDFVTKRRPSQKTVSVSSDCESPLRQKRKIVRREQVSTENSATDTPCYKEVTVDLEDLDVLRSFLAKTNVWEVDLRKFDRDDKYKISVLFKITPLVTVDRCPQIARMLRRPNHDVISLKDFATKLGLRRVRRGSDSDNDTNKENRARNRLERRAKRNKRSKTENRGHSDARGKLDSKQNVNTNKVDSVKTISDQNKNSRHDRVNNESKTVKVHSKHSIDVRNRTNNVDKTIRNKVDSSSDYSEKISYDRVRHSASTVKDKKKDSGSSSDFQTETIGSSKTKQGTIAIRNNVNSDRIKRERGRDGKYLPKDFSSSKNSTLETINSGSDVDSDGAKRTDASSKRKKRDGDTRNNLETNVLKNKAAYKGCVPPRATREYSQLEDHAIVAWLSNGGRANKVNGNRLWRELQPIYPRLTGLERSWHSLRNRYLRYVLPSLGSLALQPAQAKKLRAAAAQGELKARKLSSRSAPHPALHLPPVRSAWAARPRSLRHESSPELSRDEATTNSREGRRFRSGSKDHDVRCSGCRTKIYEWFIINER